MGALNFQTSRKTYTVNGKNEISFDPADINFVHRLFDLMEELEKQQGEGPKETDNVFEEFARRDKEMRAKIDAVFDEPVCDLVFGATNVFSPAGGLPVCMNFLLAVIDEVDVASEAETETSEKVEAYIHKYEKKYGKRK